MKTCLLNTPRCCFWPYMRTAGCLPVNGVASFTFSSFRVRRVYLTHLFTLTLWLDSASFQRPCVLIASSVIARCRLMERRHGAPGTMGPFREGCVCSPVMWRSSVNRARRRSWKRRRWEDSRDINTNTRSKSGLWNKKSNLWDRKSKYDFLSLSFHRTMSIVNDLMIPVPSHTWCDKQLNLRALESFDLIKHILLRVRFYSDELKRIISEPTPVPTKTEHHTFHEGGFLLAVLDALD